MPRGTLGLSELAKHGFSELTEAKNALEHRGLSPELFDGVADPDRSLYWWGVLHDTHPTALAQLSSDPGSQWRLAKILGASDGLAEFFRRNPSQLSVAMEPPVPPVDRGELIDRLARAVQGSDDTTRDLRIAYRTELARIAIWDVTRDQPIDAVEQVAQALADIADAVVEVALRCARDELGVSEECVPFAVIAMGKAGARELNYVSDVDVIYVTESPDGEADGVVPHATRLAQRLQKIIMEFGVEPGLWEVDANLRPEGKDGALVRTLESHLAYYERWAKDWEFQALLKSRPMAGSLELGQKYRDRIEPMVWAASSRDGFVEQVQRMRERVTDHIPKDEVDVQLKLGPGGLRDVEFTIQLLQLVHGGSDVDVRQRDTLGALRALASKGYVGRPESAEFDRAYRFLRTLEHRLQLRLLGRTHLMPRDEDQLRVLARSSRLAESSEGLVESWRAVQRQVRTLHERLFYRPLLQAVAGLSDDDFGVELTSEQAADRLRATGFRDPEGAIRHIGALTEGVSRRAQIQRNLLPVVLRWLADGTDPDRGLLGFRRLSDDLGDAPWFLRMLRDSSGAAQRLTRVLSTSGFAGKLLERVPDGAGWLDDGEDLRPRPAEALHQEAQAIAERYAEDLDSGGNALRQLRRRELLRLGMASILGESDTATVQAALTDMTEAYLGGAWRLVSHHYPGVEFAVIAMGRFGGRELGFSSDADVVYVVRDAGAGDEAVSKGAELVRQMGSLVEDPMFPFELDAGLRPEGKNGPLVRSLDAYEAYYERWALGWEAQALLRARDVVGDEALRADFIALANRFRFPESFPASASTEIRRIKARVEAERLPQGADPARHVKLGRGSLSDVEWLVQLLQLQHAGAHEELRRADTLGSLEAMVSVGLIGESDAKVLGEAWLLSSDIRNALTLYGKHADVLPVDRPSLEGVARLLGYPARSATRLEEHYLRTTRHSRAVFEKYFFA